MMMNHDKFEQTLKTWNLPLLVLLAPLVITDWHRGRCLLLSPALHNTSLSTAETLFFIKTFSLHTGFFYIVFDSFPNEHAGYGRHVHTFAVY